MSRNASLKKELGLIPAISIVIGIVIGSGVFVKPGKVLAAVNGSSGLALSAWIIGGLMSLSGGLVISELAARIHRSGGIYAYIEELYGKLAGFLCGWIQTFIYGPALMSALALFFGTLASEFVGLAPGSEKIIAIGALFLLGFINALSSRYGSLLQVVSTFAKLMPIVVVALAGIFMGQEPIFSSPATATAEGTSGILGMGAAILATLWAYDGWILVGNMVGEMKEPKRDLPRALLFGLGIVTVAYIAVNLSLFHTLPHTQIMELNAKAAGAAATVLFGPAGGILISLGILVSIFGCLNGNILTASRVPHAMAERKELPFHVTLSKVHPRFGTPINALIFQLLVALIMIVAANPDWLTDIAVFSMYLFFTLAFVGLFRLRKKDPNFSGFKVPLFPLIGGLAVLSGLYIIIATILNQPIMTLYAGIILSSGVPAYLWMKRGTPPEIAQKVS